MNRDEWKFVFAFLAVGLLIGFVGSAFATAITVLLS